MTIRSLLIDSFLSRPFRRVQLRGSRVAGSTRWLVAVSEIDARLSLPRKARHDPLRGVARLPAHTNDAPAGLTDEHRPHDVFISSRTPSFPVFVVLCVLCWGRPYERGIFS